MKLIKAGGEFWPNLRRTEIDKKETFEYFKYGSGWKKTKKYQVIDGVELPERWDKNLTWFDVAKLYDQYGINVANVYAECMTAGIVSKQTAIGYGKIYAKIKHLITDDFSPKFFELMRCDYTLACFGIYALDIIGMDASFEKMETLTPDWLYNDKSHGRWDHKPHGSIAWRLNDSDNWCYDFTKLPDLKVYKAMESLYKGKECSMKEYVLQKYGQLYVDAIEAYLRVP